MKKLKVYNSITKSLEEFEPNNQNDVKIYVCGPTVYDFAHLGHARTYISFDIIRRILTDYFGYNVTYAMNITNIDDKIINRARESGKDWKEIANKYEKEFFDDMDRLNVLRPDYVTKIDEYVEMVVEFIDKLIQKGFAYVAEDESVYFDVNEYKEKGFAYHVLRPEHKQDEVLLEGEENTSVKKNPYDFVLWKKSKLDEPSWDSPWSRGRPGWHIECSAMSSNIFGETLDIHGGGIDLAFPHHENEIAQCVGSFGKKWVKYFMHTGHLNIKGQKMSKSLKNFYTIQDTLKTHGAETLRMLFAQHSWEGTFSYDLEQFKRATTVIEKFKVFISTVDYLKMNFVSRVQTKEDLEIHEKIVELKDLVHAAFCDNFNSPRVIDLLYEFLTTVNSRIKSLHIDVLSFFRNYLTRILGILGFDFSAKVDVSCEALEMVNLLNDFRESVRKATLQKEDKKVFFSLCDDVRKKLSDYGFIIDDTKDKSMIRRKF